MAGLPALPSYTLKYAINARLWVGELTFADFARARLLERLTGLIEQLPAELRATIPPVDTPGFPDELEYAEGQNYRLMLNLQRCQEQTIVANGDVTMLFFHLGEQFEPYLVALGNLAEVVRVAYQVEVMIHKDDLVPGYVMAEFPGEKTLAITYLPARNWLRALGAS